MTARIEQNEQGYWNVYLNDRLVMADESYPVACNVEMALNGRESLCSECGEVAETILAKEPK